jgi:hypothetical protein
MAQKQDFDLFVARKTGSYKVCQRQFEYWECKMKDCDEEKENLFNKKQKLLKALEAIKVAVSAYIYFFILYIFILTDTQLKLCSNTSII